MLQNLRRSFLAEYFISNVIKYIFTYYNKPQEKVEFVRILDISDQALTLEFSEEISEDEILNFSIKLDWTDIQNIFSIEQNISSITATYDSNNQNTLKQVTISLI